MKSESYDQTTTGKCDNVNIIFRISLIIILSLSPIYPGISPGMYIQFNRYTIVWGEKQIKNRQHK